MNTLEQVGMAWLGMALAHGLLAQAIVLVLEPALGDRPALRSLLWRIAILVPPCSAAIVALFPSPLLQGGWQVPPPGSALAMLVSAMAGLGVLVVLSHSLSVLGGLHQSWERSQAIHEPADTAWARLVAASQGYHGPVVVTTHPSLSIPMVSADGTIVLPTWFDGALSLPERRAVIAHELGHLIRRDPLVTALASWITMVFWMQPLGILARRRMRDAAEECADAFAVGVTGCGLDLARALLLTSQRPTAPPAELASLLSPHRGTLLRRVARVLGPNRPPAHRVGRRLSVALALALAVLLASTISPAPPPSLPTHAGAGLSGFGLVTTTPAIWTPDDGAPAAPRSGRYP